MQMKNHNPIFTTLALAVALAGTSVLAVADEAKEQETVNAAQRTISDFTADPNMTWFRNHVGSARAVLIVPQQLKGAWFIGGSGGKGVLLARDVKTNTWSQPAFYGMGAASFGLQFGGEVAQVVLMSMTEKGVNAFLSTKFQLGADVSVAAGPVGAGAQAATADVLSFSRTKGVFGGVSAEGSVISPLNDANNAYYGKPVTVVDILIRHSVSNKGASGLVNTVAKIGK